MNFNTVATKQVRAGDLKHKFDVREDASVSTESSNQIVAQGGTKQNPLVTKDLVTIDGRTGADAEAAMYAQKNGCSLEDAVVEVDVVGFSWEGLTTLQQAEVEAESLRRNSPSSRIGYRRFSTEGDYLKTVLDFVAKGLTVETVVKLLSSFLSSDRIKRLYKAAQSQHDQQLLALTREAMGNNSKLSVEDAARQTRLPKRLIGSVIKVQGGRGPRPVVLSEKQKKQNAVASAVDSVERYAKTNMEGLRTGKLSAKTVLEYNDWNVKQAQKLLTKTLDVRERAAKEASNLIPRFQTV